LSAKEQAVAAGSDREQQLAEARAALHASETALVARGAALDATRAKLEASELKHAQLQAQLPSALASMQRQAEEVLKLTALVVEAQQVKADLSSRDTQLAAERAAHAECKQSLAVTAARLEAQQRAHAEALAAKDEILRSLTEQVCVFGGVGL
jgi:hypothetical protein